MANIKITDLVAYTTPISADVFPVVDTVNDVTKKITVEDLLAGAPAGTAAAPSIAFVNDNNTGIYNSAPNELSISTGGAQRVLVDSTGNVGIANANPAATLHVQNNDNAPSGIIQQWTADLGTNTRSCRLIAPELDDAAAPFIFFTNNSWNFRVDLTDAFIINSAANIGVRETSPTSPLHITTSNNWNFPSLFIQRDASNTSTNVKMIAFGLQADNSAQATASSASFIGLNTDTPPTTGDTVLSENAKLNLTSPGGVIMPVGPLGVGTSTPDQILDLQDSSTGSAPGPFMRLTDGYSGAWTANTDSSGIEFYSADSSGPGIGVRSKIANTVETTTGAAQALTFSTRLNVGGGALEERMRIQSNGNIGIGTNNPAGTFNVEGTGAAPSLTYDTANLVNLDQGSVQLAIGIDPSAPFGAYLQGRDNTDGSRIISLNPMGGRVGIGTRNPGRDLHITSAAGGIRLQDSDETNSYSDIFQSGSAVYMDTRSDTNRGQRIFRSWNGSNQDEIMRLDNSGKVLIGASSARGVGTASVAEFEVETDSIAATFARNTADAVGAVVNLGKSRGANPGGTTIVQAGDRLGEIRFAGADGTDLVSIGATIRAKVDGTPGANDMPGRLEFLTSASGTASPATVAMTIKENDIINFANCPTYADDTAAGSGGLVAGDVYKTSTGELRIKL